MMMMMISRSSVRSEHSQNHITISISRIPAILTTHTIQSQRKIPFPFPYLPTPDNLSLQQPSPTTKALSTPPKNTHHVPPPCRILSPASPLAPQRPPLLLQHTRSPRSSRQDTASTQQHATQRAKSRQNADPRRGLAV
jgi:hypothetical protein